MDKCWVDESVEEDDEVIWRREPKRTFKGVVEIPDDSMDVEHNPSFWVVDSFGGSLVFFEP